MTRLLVQYHAVPRTLRKLKMKEDTSQSWTQKIKPRAPQLRYIWVFIFAIEEINKNPNLLPNVTLGYHVHNSCKDENKAIESVLHILSGSGEIVPNYFCHGHDKLVGVIGDESSECSSHIYNILNLYGYSQISYGATDSLFSNKQMFPSFFRTLPSDQVQFLAITLLLKHFNWTWIGVILTNDYAGENQGQELRKVADAYDICIEYIIFVGSEISGYKKQIISPESIKVFQKSTSKIVVVCSMSLSTLVVIERRLSRHSEKTFILPSGPLSHIEPALEKRSFHGSLAFSPTVKAIPHLTTFLDGVSLASHPNDFFLEHLFATHTLCLTPNRGLNFVMQHLLKQKLHQCGNTTYLRNLSSYLHFSHLFGTAYHVYKAVYAMAYALHKMQLYVSSIPRNNSLRYNKHLHMFFLRRTNFEDPTGGRGFFNEKGEMASFYGIYNFQIINKTFYEVKQFGFFNTLKLELTEFNNTRELLKWRTAGFFLRRINFEDPTGGRGFFNEKGEMASFYGIYNFQIINKTFYEVPVSRCSEECPKGYRRAKKPGSHRCCFNCVQCLDGEVSSDADKWSCVKCPEDQWPNDDNRCVPKLVEFLSYKKDLISIVVSIITSLCFIQSSIILSVFIIYRDTAVIKANNQNLSYLLLVSIMLSFLSVHLFIGRPGHATCMARHTLYGITSSVAISSILAKTFMVYSAFRATKPGSSWRKYIGVKLTNCLVFICSFIQALISLIWLLIFPPFPENNTHLYPDIIIIQCNEGSVLAFALLLGYMGLLAAVSFIVAFLARHLPDSFNEAKYITFSMLVFCSVWVTFIPAYLSATGKSTVLVEIFAIISSTVGILGCIFYPKCYIILLRPELNVKNVILRRTK
ncbi:vomeronasal type-2 receptor 26-like [Gastrophryne carolinensis]